MPSIVVSGNCQTYGIAKCLRLLMPSHTIHEVSYDQLSREGFKASNWPDLEAIVAGDGGTVDMFNRMDEIAQRKIRIQAFPSMFFTGYHPDTVYPKAGSERILSPTGTNHSSIALAAFLQGRTIAETIQLFNERVFRHLGYFDHFDASKTAYLKQGQVCGLDLKLAFDRWAKQPPFVFTPNHPKIRVLVDVSRCIAMNLGHCRELARLEDMITDTFQRLVVWPVYPELASHFGITGDYSFKLYQGEGDENPRVMDLPEYIESSFEAYSKIGSDRLIFERMKDPRYCEIYSLTFKRTEQSDANPYRSLDDRHFWRRAVAQTPFHEIDPSSFSKIILTKDIKVATAGSCFAQHISRRLQAHGLNYLTTDAERPKDVRPNVYENASQFSARYGNIYSSLQLLQLMQRAYDDFLPRDDVWASRVQGRFLDPFRPSIVEGGFLSSDELREDRQRHLGAVRRLFETMDVLVFTLGLTEVWRSNRDGAVVPVTPGAVAEGSQQENYEFSNLSIDEIRQHLGEFLDRLSNINPKASVILTVSPVPLIATFTDDHVLTATTYSKSVLRAAAGEITKKYPQVEYFPSYEIITGNFSLGRYFDPNLRDITPEGVDHVMRCFAKNHGLTPAGSSGSLWKAQLDTELAAGTRIVCDESLIDP